MEDNAPLPIIENEDVEGENVKTVATQTEVYNKHAQVDTKSLLRSTTRDVATQFSFIPKCVDAATQHNSENTNHHEWRMYLLPGLLSFLYSSGTNIKKARNSGEEVDYFLPFDCLKKLCCVYSIIFLYLSFHYLREASTPVRACVLEISDFMADSDDDRSEESESFTSLRDVSLNSNSG